MIKKIASAVKQFKSITSKFAVPPESAKQQADHLLALSHSVEELGGRVNELYSKSADTHAISYLGRDLCLVKTKWGGHVVVPGYNVDVAVGIIRDGIHEPWTTRLVQESLSRGQTYVNVGSNFGYYTSLGGLIVGSEGKVFSFEANPSVFAVLLKTIMFAGIPDRVTAFNRAAYRVSGSDIGFFFDHQFAGGGHLEFGGDDRPGVGDGFWSADSIASIVDSNGRWVAAKGIMNTFKARTLALDDVLAGVCVDLLHCDVEAAEPYVIEGARNTIKNSPKLCIIFEWSAYGFLRGSDEYRDTVKGMWDFLTAEGFSIRRLTPYIHPDGGIELSGPLSYEGFITGEHGDYFATRSPP